MRHSFLAFVALSEFRVFHPRAVPPADQVPVHKVPTLTLASLLPRQQLTNFPTACTDTCTTFTNAVAVRPFSLLFYAPTSSAETHFFLSLDLFRE